MLQNNQVLKKRRDFGEAQIILQREVNVRRKAYSYAITGLFSV